MVGESVRSRMLADCFRAFVVRGARLQLQQSTTDPDVSERRRDRTDFAGSPPMVANPQCEVIQGLGVDR